MSSVLPRRVSNVGVLVGWILITLGLTSCTSTASGAPLPRAPNVVDVRMTEYRFDYPPVVPSGRVLFRITNAGKELHDLIMVPLPEEDPPLAAMLADNMRQVLTPYAGIRDQVRGAGATFAVDLVAGRRYAMLCVLADAQGRSHSVLGMASEFRPVAPAEAVGSRR